MQWANGPYTALCPSGLHDSEDNSGMQHDRCLLATLDEQLYAEDGRRVSIYSENCIDLPAPLKNHVLLRPAHPALRTSGSWTVQALRMCQGRSIGEKSMSVQSGWSIRAIRKCGIQRDTRRLLLPDHQPLLVTLPQRVELGTQMLRTPRIEP